MNKIVFNLFALLLLTLVACNKDNIDTTDTKYDEVKVEVTNSLLERRSSGTDSFVIGCLNIEFPIGFLGANNTTHTANNNQELEALLFSNTEIFDFVYPINGTVYGESITIANLEELTEVVSQCIPDEGWSVDEFPAFNISFENSCFTLKYPLSLKDIQGNIITINNQEEMNTEVCSDQLFFVFPLTLKNEAGEDVVVNDNDELFEVLATCNNFGVIDTIDLGWNLNTFGCYTIKLPVNFNLENGSTLTVATQEEFNLAFINSAIVGFQFPITLIKEDGTELAVNSETALEEAMEACNFGGGFPSEDIFLLHAFSLDSIFNEPCFKIVYPLSLESKQGGIINTITVQNDAEFKNILFNPTNTEYKLLYPVSVTKTKNNQLVIIEDKEELFELISDCK